MLDKEHIAETLPHQAGIISSIRMCVEHAIGGMKRFGMISGIFRNKNGFDDIVTRLCAGLWNFHIMYG